ncbi:hypothetical protein DFP92_1233, partial [Yoonia sediminilitoris]
MADFVVNTNSDDSVDDDGLTTLREALALADALAGADTITFDLAEGERTIILGGSELVLSSDVTIDGDINGDDVADITVSGDGQSRVFRVAQGTAELDSLTITGGRADDYGAGIVVLSRAELFLTNSTVSGNSVEFQGGGIANFGTATLTNSMLSGNTSARDGGGMHNTGNLTLTDSTLSGNMAQFGGGINNVGTATLINSTLSGNEAFRGGGIYNRGTATLTNSTLSENTAESTGGGISNTGIATLTNSTLSGNMAVSNGGGIYNFGNGTLALTNSTLSGNTSAGNGGGISNRSDATLTNSIVLGNSANVAGAAEIGGLSAVTATNSITGANGETVADVFAGPDPLTGGGLLGDNGGPVQTIALKADATNPALDAGDDTVAPATDATGAERFDIANVGNDGMGFGDLGALELQPETRSLVVTTSEDVVDAIDDVTSLREAIAYADSLAGEDTITFDLAEGERTIILGGSELVLFSDVTIDGDIN